MKKYFFAKKRLSNLRKFRFEKPVKIGTRPKFLLGEKMSKLNWRDNEKTFIEIKK